MKIGSNSPLPMAEAKAGMLAPAKDAKLRKAAQQMEGTFVEQMYKSMRETVPEGGMFDGGSGEEMFTGLLDQHVASDTPIKWQQHGLSESIYRQMRDAVVQQQGGATAPPAGASDGTSDSADQAVVK